MSRDAKGGETQSGKANGGIEESRDPNGGIGVKRDGSGATINGGGESSGDGICRIVKVEVPPESRVDIKVKERTVGERRVDIKPKGTPMKQKRTTRPEIKTRAPANRPVYRDHWDPDVGSRRSRERSRH
ncbi:hypothetical protein HDV00_004098 [Rhizophlyctis rosea]|nr:hypothetical protein HDV00_004098 [Rhizophlyctis rosea]